MDFGSFYIIAWPIMFPRGFFQNISSFVFGILLGGGIFLLIGRSGHSVWLPFVGSYLLGMLMTFTFIDGTAKTDEFDLKLHLFFNGFFWISLVSLIVRYAFY